MRYVLAVDIGGSKSRYVMLDEGGRTVKETETIGFGKAEELTEDLPPLRAALTEIVKEYAVCAVAVNLGGKNTEQIRTVVQSCFPDAAVAVYRESQGTAALALGAMYRAEVVLLAGTGTIAVAAAPNGQRVVCGGWGTNIGDGGSGYDIGLCAVRQALAALDKTAPLTALQREITGCEEPPTTVTDLDALCRLRDAVRTRLQVSDRRAMAARAKIVAIHAARGETDALEIMQNAGRRMGELVADCAAKLYPFMSQKVVVCGGLVHNRALWQAAFEEAVKQSCSICEFTYVADGLMQGTAALAAQKGDFVCSPEV